MRKLITGTVIVLFLVALAVGITILALSGGRTDADGSLLTAEAVMVSASGAEIGTVSFRQKGGREVLVAVSIRNVAPGGHAIAVHSAGACTPDFNAAGDHFDPGANRGGLVHSSWKGEVEYGDHGGDLPNIYAYADGSARADFVTDGFTLQDGEDHSVFDADGSAVVVHEKPQNYDAVEGNTGARVACGVIARN